MTFRNLYGSDVATTVFIGAEFLHHDKAWVTNRILFLFDAPVTCPSPPVAIPTDQHTSTLHAQRVV